MIRFVDGFSCVTSVFRLQHLPETRRILGHRWWQSSAKLPILLGFCRCPGKTVSG